MSGNADKRPEAGALVEGTEVLLTEDRLRTWASQGATGVVVISCKRPQYLERAMRSILAAKRDPAEFPIVISQDGFDAAMTDMVSSKFVSKGLAFHMHHQHESNAKAVASRTGGNVGYVYIAQHFGFAMRKMFDEFGFEQVIFLEEDLEVSPDFFSYFGTMAHILQEDRDLFCVSAWNDNGYATLVEDPRAAYRTDFFPGLGWMMLRRMWDEVRDRWAQAYWDEFMRRPDVRKNRQCIRPEISRTFTFGEEGTSAGQFYAGHLSHIKLNTEPVQWETLDVSYLKTTSSFDDYLRERIEAAKSVRLQEIDRFKGARESIRIEYDDARNYRSVAKKFRLMEDEKEGIRRMSYRGVIPFAWEGNRIFLHTGRWPGRQV